MSSYTDPKSNPFADGVWIFFTLGGCDAIAKVEDNQSKEDLINELMVSKCICVTLKKRYILKQLQFPMPVMDGKGRPTGEWNTGAIATVGKHEINLELLNEFPLHICLNNVSFIDEFADEDKERLRITVINAEIGAETMIRATRANLVLSKNTLIK